MAPNRPAVAPDLPAVAGQDAADAEPSRGGRPRDEAREQAILDAATDLLAEVGYEALSIEAVASRAGSSKATIYRRWPGKAELIAEALRRHHPSPALAMPDTGSLRGDLLAIVQAIAEGISGVDGALLCGLAVAIRSDAEFGRLLSAQKAEDKREVASLIIARAQHRGELPAHVATTALLDVAPAVLLFRQMNGEPLDSDFAEHVVDDILIPLLRS